MNTISSNLSPSPPERRPATTQLPVIQDGVGQGRPVGGEVKLIQLQRATAPGCQPKIDPQQLANCMRCPNSGAGGACEGIVTKLLGQLNASPQ
jgi:hypothetical protein